MTWHQELVRPVFVPSLVYAAGAAALLPAQVLLALQVGFSPAGVTGVMTWIGAFAIVSSVIAGRLIDRIGEQRAVTLVSIAGAVGLGTASSLCVTHVAGARWTLVLSLTLFDLTDAVWSIARQGIVADLTPAAARGRAMNLYGACQRLGRVVGPLIAAAVLSVTGPAAVFPVAGVIVLVALTLMLRGTPATTSAPSAVSDPHPDQSGLTPVTPNLVGANKRSSQWRWRHSMALLGAGVLILSALRTAKETLLPLWAAHGVHLDGTRISLILALASSTELLLFWPAGIASDRCGRAPVVVTAMLLMSSGLLLAPLSHATAWFLGCAVLIGLGDGTGAGIIKTLGADLAPPAARATFLGQWQGIASAGSLLAPAVASVAIALTSLPVAVCLDGVVGLAGATWMAWWTPRLLPRTEDRNG